jgi:predicted nucleotidyltransferase
MESGLTFEDRQAIQRLMARVRSALGEADAVAIAFGSKARGEATTDSDLDLLVVLSRDDFRIRRLIFDLAYEVYLETDVMIAPLVLSRGALDALKQSGRRLGREIERDGVAV